MIVHVHLYCSSSSPSNLDLTTSTFITVGVLEVVKSKLLELLFFVLGKVRDRVKYGL